MGREFIDLFEEWAVDYDKSVVGEDPQYEEVFANYDAILNEVVRQSTGTVAEFGVGTGNLTLKLLQAGHHVIGIEPSEAMRKIASNKIPSLTIIDGDFISYPDFEEQVDTIVSTYAFHHLTDVEKEAAIKKFAALLPKEGKIVFGDTLFKTESDKQRKIAEAVEKGYDDLAEDLNREYYPTLAMMKNAFEKHHFDVSFKQMNDFVWVITADKK
ncbi:class I SAM-dependent DNA methyltransferase [Oceanobacillus saliphilus]|uniref:class I SAM-dependent DNA methyltransferase n=1 Tax=Oceanobacillus saliphilus TaxID=2925834 RepID=UPI00201DC306|nr:class I SAM-dependent methyltransferase [Oceanobacillus saliphilus]